jgi:hypothetical protein
MASQNRETLKQYFQTGSTPTQAEFADLIDSALNQVDDSITADEQGQIGIGNPAPAANLNVRGKLFTALAGTVSVAQGATLAIGKGTHFDIELAAGDAIQIGAQRFEVASITDSAHLELAVAATAVINDAGAFRDANLLLIENGNGNAQFIIDKSGNVGIGTATPTARLHVNGKVIANELAGQGSGLTNLSAANLEGTLKAAQLPVLTAEQIPDLAASKITSGQLNVAQLPALTPEQIPDLSASKITSGQLKPDQLPALTEAQIPDLHPTKIIGPLNLDQLPALTVAQIPDLPASKITGLPTSPDNEWAGELKKTISVADGRIGIGPAPPFTELVVSSEAPGELGPVLTLINGGGGAGSGAAIDFDGWQAYDAPSTARIQSVDDGEFSSHLTFQSKEPGAPGNALAERLRITSTGQVGIGTSTPQSQVEIAAQDGLRISGYQPFITLEDTSAGKKCGYLQSADGNLNFIPDSFHAQNSAAMMIENGTGTVKVSGTLQANQFEGSGAGITGISAANITGQLSPAQLPSGGPAVTEISAANITGVLNTAQIPSLDKITGVLEVSQLPASIPASSMAGLDQLPFLTDLIRRITALENGLSLVSVKALRFDGVATNIMLGASTNDQIELFTPDGGYQHPGMTLQVMVNPTEVTGELPLLTYNYGDLLGGNPSMIQLITSQGFPLLGTTAAFKVSIRNGTLYFCVSDPEHVDPDAAPVELTTLATVTPNQWSLVTLVFDYQTGVHLFVEGQEVGQMSCENNFLDNMCWGFGNCGNAYFQGAMANITLWNAVRSAGDIAATPRRRLTPQEISSLQTQGLVGYWPLDEGSGSIAEDKTATANNGSITAPNW